MFIGMVVLLILVLCLLIAMTIGFFKNGDYEGTCAGILVCLMLGFIIGCAIYQIVTNGV